MGLDVRWVQHDSNRSTKGLWWQVLSEVGSDQSVGSMGSGNLTPDNSNLGTSDFLLRTVNVGNTLTQVELGILRVGHTVNLDQRHLGVGYVL